MQYDRIKFNIPKFYSAIIIFATFLLWLCDRVKLNQIDRKSILVCIDALIFSF
jgi:hypothetical protein